MWKVESDILESIPQSKIDKFVKEILQWYEHNKRDYLFWRNTNNPYFILISEIMLQKTTVKQVQELIHKFIEHFPTPKDLVDAPLEDIKKIITPLGMEHKRAERLKKLGIVLIEKFGGKIPETEEELLSLPGVGQYIANGVLCLAFNREAPLVDTNIVRILERVFDIRSNRARARTDEKIWEFVKGITPSNKSREINLALLDHGALICTAKKPKCPICPLNKICIAYQKGIIQYSFN